jgi:hypothetical protein
MAQEHAAGKPCLAFRDHEANGKTARVAVRRGAPLPSFPEQTTRLASGSALKWYFGLGTIPEVK